MIAELFSRAIERLTEWGSDNEVDETSSMTWIHTRGLYGPWDAPLGMRAELLDEEDPAPAEYVDPPVSILDVDDPDELLRHRVAYAAQIAVLDACLGGLVDALEGFYRESETLIMVMGSRGFALGEHRAIGTECKALFSERLHLPWLLHRCGDSIPKTPVYRIVSAGRYWSDAAGLAFGWCSASVGRRHFASSFTRRQVDSRARAGCCVGREWRDRCTQLGCLGRMALRSNSMNSMPSRTTDGSLTTLPHAARTLSASLLRR